jgi:BirA family biotin operon repressor/biotin-[acetyl-CoA-carboxylase] ligase
MELVEEYIHTQKYNENFIIIAEQQIAGRGRKGNDWLSPIGGLWFNIALNHITNQKTFTLFIGSCILKALIELTKNSNFKIKWPNDINLHNKKICGIICSQFTQYNFISIGIGLNTNCDISQPDTAGSIKSILNLNINNEIYIEKIINNITENINEFEEKGFEQFKNFYSEYDDLKDKNIKILSGNETKQGLYQGINDEGALLLKTTDSIEVIYSGSVYKT